MAKRGLPLLLLFLLLPTAPGNGYSFILSFYIFLYFFISYLFVNNKKKVAAGPPASLQLTSGRILFPINHHIHPADAKVSIVSLSISLLSLSPSHLLLLLLSFLVIIIIIILDI
jgi:hypothetical protein